MAGVLKQCEKCGKMLDESTQFYQYKDGTKMEMCKKCITMHINNFEEDTFLWLLEKIDVPYVREEWNVLRDRAYAKNPNLNGMSVFGKYLSKMKLRQWKDYGWADSERLQALNEAKNRTKIAQQAAYEQSIRQDFEAGEISEAEYKTLTSTETLYNSVPIVTQPPAADNPYIEKNFVVSEEDVADIGNDLTEEDKRKLAIKWGRLYKPYEWVALEQDYVNMTNSFDIQDADTINALIVICKTNLKMNQALDCGDIDGFQKLSKVSESLRKSAKFTAAQNKEEKSDFVDSVGELVAYCEKNGGAIPKYEIKTDLDIVDTVIKDLKSYTKSLVTEDKALAEQIENYLKKLEVAEQRRQDKIDAIARGETEATLSDDDIAEFYDRIENERSLDEEVASENWDKEEEAE